MNKRIPIFIGLLLVAIAVWLQITSNDFIRHFIVRLENLAYDMQLRTKLFTHQEAFQSSVAIVDVDDKSLLKEGRWPWSRAKMGTLIDDLLQQGAVVIAMDMIFPEKEDNIIDQILQMITVEKLPDLQIEPALKQLQPFFDNDVRFAKSLKQGDTVLGQSFLPRAQMEGVLGAPVLTLTRPDEKQLEIITGLGFIGNIPVLQAAEKSAGFVNVFADDDGVIRRVPLLLRYQDKLYPSLALEAVRLFLLGNVSLITAPYDNSISLEGVRVGNYSIPTDAKAQVIVPFRGKSFTFPYFSATDVLNKKTPPDALAGKIIFIGTSATGTGDLKATAIESVFPGVEVQATIADGILANTFSYKPAWALGAQIFLIIFLGGLFAFVFPYFGPRILSFLMILVPVALMFANNWLWIKSGLIISVFVPIALTIVLAMTNMIYGYLFETRRRERLKEMFGQYVPEKHIDEMLKNSGGSYGLFGEDRDMKVLFADIRNFTSISERMTAAQLKEMLNEFFTPMTEIIFKHQGTIDKYVGDLIMAFWGAPLKDKRHAQHAVNAALEMQERVAKFKLDRGESDQPEIQIGIGLNSGTMSVGDMGSKFRRNYTVLGDAVNLASRVEGLSKYYGAKIVVTESTQKDQKNVVFRQLDRVRVKGKVAGVGIYEPLCRKIELTPELSAELERSEQAINYYFNSDWQKAHELFTKLSEDYPKVKLYQLYVHRVEEFEKSPPPSDWGGIYTHMSK